MIEKPEYGSDASPDWCWKCSACSACPGSLMDLAGTASLLKGFLTPECAD